MDTPELSLHAEQYLRELKRSNASAHTLRNYRSDLEQWIAYLTPPGEGSAPPAPSEIDLLLLREWLAHLYDRNLEPASIRRKLAAVRSFFKFMLREGVLVKNVARLLRTPKAPKHLPRVPTAEQTNRLIDQLPAEELAQPFPARDRLIFELLYGCGLRISELEGANLEDFDYAERWIRVRGKGKKERQVPYGAKAAEALDNYLSTRDPKPGGESALLLGRRGLRMPSRAIYAVVKFYSRMLGGDDSIHPHTLRHAFATHLLSSGADLRSIQELLGHSQLSTTQKYTQISLTDLMAVYDKAHPLALKSSGGGK
jgi:integrase/recombinase XerC